MRAAKKITVSVISDLTTDQRVIRICNTLVKMGFSVAVIARCFNDSLPLDKYYFSATRIKCTFRKGIMQYAEFNIKLFFRLLFAKTDYFLANDLDVLIPNFVIGKWRRKGLFYDTHEYFTGVPELRDLHIKRKTWKFFENWIFPKLKTVYTVNESVKNKYQQEYGNDIGIVRNVPVTDKVNPLEIPEHWKGKIILLLQGAGINEGRGGIELLEALQYLPENYFLVMIGSGTQWNEIKEKKNQWNLQHRVEMLDKMPPSALKKITPVAHIGFSLDSFDDFNCLYNLPNKVFDYIHAGVPIIATATPEVKFIIETYHCGICIENNDPITLATSVLKMMGDKESYLLYQRNCIVAAEDLCWENESKKLEMIYRPYL
jgi:glycosyltransferase involved in cell wall biosynthesis